MEYTLVSLTRDITRDTGLATLSPEPVYVGFYGEQQRINTNFELCTQGAADKLSTAAVSD